MGRFHKNEAGTRFARGFTLVELLITVAVFSVLLLVVTASYEPLISNNRLASSVNTFMGSLARGRTEAGKLSTAVTICSSSNGTSCNAGANWENGWIIFNDADADAVVDAGDGDRIVKVFAALGNQDTLRRSGFAFAAGRIQFNSRGELRGGNARPGSFVLCDGNGVNAEARAVVINLSGSVRMAVDENNDGILNDHTGAGGNVSCPP